MSPLDLAVVYQHDTATLVREWHFGLHLGLRHSQPCTLMPTEVEQMGQSSSPYDLAAQSAIQEPDQTVFVVDDDESMRETLGRVFRSVGLKVRLFLRHPRCSRANSM